MTNSRHIPLALPYAFPHPLSSSSSLGIHRSIPSSNPSSSPSSKPTARSFRPIRRRRQLLPSSSTTPSSGKPSPTPPSSPPPPSSSNSPSPLALALLLNRPDIKGRAIFRLIFFSPSLVGMVFVGMIFSLIFEKRTGLLNVALHTLFGFNLDFPWLQEHVMLAMILAALWVYVGYNMIYFLAALQNVSKELLEAAEVDSAWPPFHRFLHITIPAIRPVSTVVVLLSIIGSFQLFELPFILLGGGGPDNQGLTVVMYLFQMGFQQGDLGYASAIGWCLAILLALFTLTQQLFAKTGRGDD